MQPEADVLPPPTDEEIIARVRPLTGEVPERILRAQTTDASLRASGAQPSVRTSWGLQGPTWHCVQTWPKAEFTALTELHRLKHRAYCPLMLRQTMPKRRGIRFLDVIEPMFSGYLFLLFDRDADPWRQAYQARGVARILTGANGRPLNVPDAALHYLWSNGREADGVFDARTKEERRNTAAQAERRAKKRAEPEVLFPSAEVGQRVKVLSGPFDGFEGICTMSADNRIRLLMLVLGANREVEFTRHEVELVA